MEPQGKLTRKYFLFTPKALSANANSVRVVIQTCDEFHTFQLETDGIEYIGPVDDHDANLIIWSRRNPTFISTTTKYPRSVPIF